MRKYKDNSIAPIIAIDFDDTISIDGNYPIPGEVRTYAKEVINFLIEIGVKVVIHTCRDTAISQERLVVCDDISPMIEWLNTKGIGYSAINKSVQFAPYHYNGRKIYAHMYVDDRAYGWINSNNAMVRVLEDFLYNVIEINDHDLLRHIRKHIIGVLIDDGLVKECRKYVDRWND